CVRLFAGLLLAISSGHRYTAPYSDAAISSMFLGTLGGPYSTAYGVNESGAVAGFGETSSNDFAPFFWSAATGMVNLGSFGGRGQANGINDQGHVVGSSRISPVGFEHAFLWKPATGMVDLGSLSNELSNAYGINNLDQVVGDTSTGNFSRHAFLWTAANGMQDLGALRDNHFSSVAAGISDFGHVVGSSETMPISASAPPGSSYHAFLWTATTGMKDLGTLGGARSFGHGVNNLGQVVGLSDDATGRERAFLWTPERGMEDLGTLPGGTSSEAYAINDRGQVVGRTTPNERPFVWTRSTGMIELPSLTGSGRAYGLNERGQIAGQAGGSDSMLHAFVWTEAATFIVTKTFDTNDGVCGADCSLREAINAANANPGSDVIVLPAGTYRLGIPGAGEDAGATGDLDITDTLAINGAGTADTIVDGGALDRVFHLHLGGSVLMRDLTVRNGSVLQANGGGIYNHQGILTMVNCAISGNVADGGSVPFAIESHVRGGGLFMDGGALTLENCTVSGNQVRAVAADVIGGGMCVNAGTVNVRNSTISGNSASSPGGAGHGGGIFDAAGVINLQSTTISANSVAGSLTITEPTSIGGGIENQSASGSLTLTSTIVAGNSAVVGPDCHGDTYRSGGYNLAGKPGAPCVFQLGVMTGNLLDADAKLGPLQDNGGPTLTHALLTGSPAIDVVPPALCPATDQRGVSRPQGSACEMGAFEVTVPKRRAIRH
ncbi:MAG TPA: choice-of-anchor Q domain-containing protein, partial [Vicinamibacterales bacterium]|nr:choice-of-anchor Q domain-containing protein [Vicinamibacterales bacterium]